MISVQNPHKVVLWGFLFACRSILSNRCTVHPVYAQRIRLGVDAAALNHLWEGRSPCA
jgi:hypothetical protein